MFNLVELYFLKRIMGWDVKKKKFNLNEIFFGEKWIILKMVCGYDK